VKDRIEVKTNLQENVEKQEETDITKPLWVFLDGYIQAHVWTLKCSYEIQKTRIW